MKADVNVQFKTETEPGETTFKQPCNMIQLNKQRCPVNAWFGRNRLQYKVTFKK